MGSDWPKSKANFYTRLENYYTDYMRYVFFIPNINDKRKFHNWFLECITVVTHKYDLKISYGIKLYFFTPTNFCTFYSPLIKHFLEPSDGFLRGIIKDKVDIIKLNISKLNIC